ncbi:YeiH family protein [Azovibrio restrictus]|uniref:YeiH family protein n=1 Tax=Azovibrio restrictus TaxID=146938 RepID=UPI0004026F53|nr:putative sulfate exporter family transporter [Azovibrio restrictus]
MNPLRSGRLLLPGLSLILAVGLAATLLATGTSLSQQGFGPLSLAILVGALLGNLLPRLQAPGNQPGLRLAQRQFLRLGVALSGFNLSLQQLLQVGGSGLLADLLVVGSTLGLGYFLGTRWLGLDRETALLTSAGSAICGAAAVVATVPVLRLEEARAAEKTAVAVATVVLFGTLAMLLYPLLARWVWLDHPGFGIYVGSTVHEVAQVVAIGHSLGEQVARDGMVVKMLRVLLLIPFLLFLSALPGRQGRETGRPAITIPWFALGFIACVGLNSLALLPPAGVELLRQLAALLLTGAMAALGLETTWARMRRAGPRPLLLGALLFLHLVLVGGLINWWLTA